MNKQIPLSISTDIFKLAPGFRRAIVVAEDIKNNPSSNELQQELRSQEVTTRQTITIEDNRLVAWRDTFHTAGIKTNKFRPSVDALTRRVLNGNELPSISTLVDIGTVLSLRHVLPCGAHSLNDVVEGLTLRMATGTEQFKAFGSSEQETSPAGEAIFVDGNVVATSKWAWRQAEHTIIRPETTAFELNIDALDVISDKELDTIITDAQSMIKKYLDVDTRVLVLSESHPMKTTIIRH